MSHLIPSGSATGNPRNKTALGPGKSLMDWVKLTNSGKDLSGTGGVLLNVTLEELAQHNKETDAWLAIGGIVYNVTEYLSFHPGGEEELMRGVGTDATKLFNTVHSWVNYQSLLKSCVVGRLKTIGSSTILTTASSGVPKNSSKDSISTLNSNLIVTKISKVPLISNENCQYISKIDWFQQLASVILIVYFKRAENSFHPFQVSVSLDSARSLSVCVEEEIGVYDLEDDVRWPCNVKVNHFRTEIRLMKENSKLWSIYGKKSSASASVRDEFCLMKVIHVSTVTHDTKLIGLEYMDKLTHYIHPGHHVRLKNLSNLRTDSDFVYVRSYTPISFLIAHPEILSNSSVVYFLIKQYQVGRLSRRLCSLQLNDRVEMSRPVGTFNCKALDKRSNLFLLAAGTGLTPFTSLIIWALRNTKSNVKLIFFNKTEEDIIWQHELDTLSSDETRFDVTYVLSKSSPNWKGLRGFASAQIMQPILIQPVEENFICICGPNLFTELCVSIIKDFGYSENDFHCFQG